MNKADWDYMIKWQTSLGDTNSTHGMVPKVLEYLVFQAQNVHSASGWPGEPPSFI